MIHNSEVVRTWAYPEQYFNKEQQIHREVSRQMKRVLGFYGKYMGENNEN